MKTDLKSLKKELKRLADIETLKNELNRIASDIKKFDMHITLTPQAQSKLALLERRFRQLLKSLTDLQKQVDSRLGRLVKLVRKATGKKGRAKTKKTARKTARKTTRKTAK